MMQTERRWRPALAAAALCLAAAAVPGRAAAPPDRTSPGSDRVEVNFGDPARFTDVGTDLKLQAEWMTDLREHLQNSAERVLPPGDRLVVTITDVARAGVVRHLPARDLRIVRDDQVPPRIDLTFQWVSPRGEVRKEGTRRLTDSAYHTARLISEDSPAALENRLVDGWLRRDIGSR